MLHLRCLAIHDDMHDTETQEFQLDLADDPARWLLTLNVCRLMMPDDTDPLHLANWHEIEALLRQLSTLYAHSHLGHAQRTPCRRWRRGRAPQ